MALSAIFAATIAVLSAGFALVPGGNGEAAPDTKAPGHVSSAACAECHKKEHADWQGSHHSWALRLPTPENVLGDFNDAVFEHRGARSRFYTRDAKYFTETDGADGKLTEFEIKFTVGVEPLQQYLVELDRGRLQALDIAWDTEKKRWFHLYPNQKLEPGDGSHWSGAYKNWQARCAECHQTNFTKGYAPKTASYQSRWSEITIGCEVCHGPGQAHVQWAKDPTAFQSRKPDGVDEMGLTVSVDPEVAESEIRLCARCHSRRSPLGANSPPSGDTFANHYKLALLRDGLYHADGQIDDEVYVYGSFLQSKMKMRGVRCSNCHEPHSGALVAEGNAICTQCHSPAGNEAFGTLKKAAYDSPLHHRHKAGSQAARCVSCHMPAKTFMQVDPRRDHGFRVPRPDLSAKLATPNACNGCHADKSAAWAASNVTKWFPGGRAGTPHYGETLYLGRTRPGAETANKLIDLALDKGQPAIVRASALDLLRRSMTPDLVPRISTLLQSGEFLLREGVLRLLGNAPAPLRVELAAPLLRDRVKAVRLEAARLMIGLSLEYLSSEDKAAARREIGAYQQSLFSRADFPETQMQIAGLAMVLRDFGTAQKALRTAVAMDPQLSHAWLTLARIQAAARQPARARKTLEQAALKLPENAEVLFQLGTFYSSAREHRHAVTVLEKSLKLAGPSPATLELLATNCFALGNAGKARFYAEELVKKYPNHRPNALVRQLLQLPAQR